MKENRITLSKIAVAMCRGAIIVRTIADQDLAAGFRSCITLKKVRQLICRRFMVHSSSLEVVNRCLVMELCLRQAPQEQLYHAHTYKSRRGLLLGTVGPMKLVVPTGYLVGRDS